jgi:hypothetical protein
MVINIMRFSVSHQKPVFFIVYNVHVLVLLPGFQKSRDIKASQGKGQGAVLAKAVVQGKTDRNSLLLGSIKCLPLSFNTFKTL